MGVSRPELLHDQRLPEMVHSIRDAHLVRPKKNDGPSGNRTRVLGFEAQEDILYPMGPLFDFYHKLLSVFIPVHCTMILSSSEILRRLKAGDLIIDPYHSASLQPASYDLRVAEETILPRGRCTLVPSIERVELPKDLAATLRCRSSLARRGVLLGGGFVDPGFRGQLTLCLTNAGAEEIRLAEGDRVVQMILQEVLNGDRLYEGRYQDSQGAVHSR